MKSAESFLVCSAEAIHEFIEQLLFFTLHVLHARVRRPTPWPIGLELCVYKGINVPNTFTSTFFASFRHLLYYCR